MFATITEGSPAARQKGHTLPGDYSKVVYGLLSLLVLYAVVRNLAGAATNGFWFDEIITTALSRQPSLRAVRAALATGVDGQPPGFYMIERAAGAIIKNREIAMRLPSILAFPCTLVCVFVYVRRRSGEVIALLSAILLLSTILFQRYAAEARPYSLMVACFAFALVCYQRLPSILWTVLLGTILALAQSFHHYSIFAMVPFGLAEMVVFLKASEFRWRVWLALILGASPLLFFWPLLAQLKAYLGAHFQITYAYTSIPSTFGEFFLVDSGYGVAVAAVCVAGAVSLYLLPRDRDITKEVSRNAELAEGTLLLGFVCLPLIAFTAVKFMHGGMRSPYLMPTILGVCLALACMLARVRPLSVVFFAVFLLFDVGLREYKFWQSAHGLRLAKPSEGLEEFLNNSPYGKSELPVVVTSGMIYTPLAYYAAEPLDKKLVYLTDEKRELQLQGSDTFDKNVKLLQRYIPLRIRDYSEFTAAHPVFLLYGEEPESYGNTWLVQELMRRRAFVQAIAVTPTRRLFFVDMRTEKPIEVAPH